MSVVNGRGNPYSELTVLIVDDDPDGYIHRRIIRVLEQTLSYEMTILSAKTVEGAVELIMANPQINVALFDGSMSEHRTLDTLPLIELVQEWCPDCDVRVAMSSNDLYQIKMMQGNLCTHQLDKGDLERSLPVLMSVVEPVRVPVMA